LFQRQAKELDRKTREVLLHQIQRIPHEQARFVPIYQQAQINGVSPRVDDSGATLIKGYPYFAPYEDLRLKKP